jgi:predicted DNA-binding protein
MEAKMDEINDKKYNSMIPIRVSMSMPEGFRERMCHLALKDGKNMSEWLRDIIRREWKKDMKK